MEGLRAQLEALGEGFTERQRRMALDELVPADLLSEMQSRVELDNYTARLDFVSRRVSHHRTLAQRAKAPALADPSGEALMAAMSAPSSSFAAPRTPDPVGALAEAVQSIQQQLLACVPDYSVDLDALGKGQGDGNKGGSPKGYGKGYGNSGGKGGGGKGPGGAGINDTCW